MKGYVTSVGVSPEKSYFVQPGVYKEWEGAEAKPVDGYVVVMLRNGGEMVGRAEDFDWPWRNEYPGEDIVAYASVEEILAPEGDKLLPDLIEVWPRLTPPDVATFGESDPFGIAPGEPGAKLDAGKQAAGVLLDFAHALGGVADVGTMGAKKYSRGGWQSVPNASERYLDAAMRHMLKHGAGEANDPESGLSHLSHATWNLLAIAELNARGTQ